jgi:hypothetical protein
MLKIATTFLAVLIAASALSTSAEARFGGFGGGGVRMGGFGGARMGRFLQLAIHLFRAGGSNSPAITCDVRYWPLADIDLCSANICFRG